MEFRQILSFDLNQVVLEIPEVVFVENWVQRVQILVSFCRHDHVGWSGRGFVNLGFRPRWFEPDEAFFLFECQGAGLGQRVKHVLIRRDPVFDDVRVFVRQVGVRSLSFMNSKISFLKIRDVLFVRTV